MSLPFTIARRYGLLLSTAKRCVRGIHRRCPPQLSSAVSKYSTEALAQPAPSNEERSYPDKITRIVDDIAKLTLMEVADLNALLKKTLNIQETPMMGGWAAPVAAAAPEEVRLSLNRYHWRPAVPVSNRLRAWSS